MSNMKDKVTPAEWRARVDLAACYRLVAHYDMSDMMANHISAAVPGEEGAFLINAYGSCATWARASRALAAMATGAKLVNVPGKVLQGTYMNYQPQTRRPYGVMEWPALLRKPDRLDPSYRE